MKPGTRFYYAQLKQKEGKPPTARLLVGTHTRVGKRPKTHRATFAHAPLGLDVPAEWCTPDPAAAYHLLLLRIRQAITHHTRAIDRLLEAHENAAKSIVIEWPEKPPGTSQP